jgi:serine/threonine-protein kinase PpkA
MEHLLQIPGYKIKKELGSGGMAMVFLALEEDLERQVALKVLFPDLSKNDRITKRFKKEAKTAAQLQHTNIVSIFKVAKWKDFHYISMEYLKDSLRDCLKKTLRVKPKEALNIVREVAKALSYAHEKGYIHRDIKPDNIMFRHDGTVVLVDFGIVKALHEESKLTKTGMSIGTPQYMSPEQIHARKLDGRADIYSLGIVLYEILVGHVPYQSNDLVTVALKHTEAPIPILPKRLVVCQPLIDKMLAKNPRDRVQDGKGIIRLIDALHFKIKEEEEKKVKRINEMSKKRKKVNAREEPKKTHSISIWKHVFFSVLVVLLIAVIYYLVIME